MIDCLEHRRAILPKPGRSLAEDKRILNHCKLQLEHTDFISERHVKRGLISEYCLSHKHEDPCLDLENCLVQMQGEIDKPRCQTSIEEINDYDFYQVAMCSSLAIFMLDANADWYKSGQAIPFLEREIGGSWICVINQLDLTKQFDQSCPKFMSLYCHKLRNCLQNKMFKMRKTAMTTAAIYGGLVIRSFGVWKTHFHRFLYCKDEVQNAYKTVTNHASFPNTVTVKRSRGNAICYWYPSLNEKDDVDKFALWLRIVHEQCKDLQKCLDLVYSDMNIQRCDKFKVEYMFPKAAKFPDIFLTHYVDFQFTPLKVGHYDPALVINYDGFFDVYPTINETCKTKTSGVITYPLKSFDKYSELLCMKKARSMTCSEFHEECSHMETCINDFEPCEHLWLNATNPAYKQNSYEVFMALQFLVMKCHKIHSTVVVSQIYVSYENPGLLHYRCNLRLKTDCGHVSKECKKIGTCLINQKPCQHIGQTEGRMGIGNFFQYNFTMDLAPIIYSCNKEYGFDHFVSLRHADLDQLDVDFMRETDFVKEPSKHIHALSFSYQDRIDNRLKWYCERSVFKRFHCSEFLDICNKIKDCIKRSKIDIQLGDIPRFAIQNIKNPLISSKCFSSGNGLLVYTIKPMGYNAYLTPFKWPDVVPENVNDFGLTLSLGQRTAVMFCANVFIPLREDSNLNDLQVDMILNECNLKKFGNFTSAIVGQVNRTVLSIRCCPLHLPWKKFSCEKWSTECNEVLNCFRIWKENVLPLHETLFSIFSSLYFRNVLLVLYLIGLIMIMIKRMYIGNKEIIYMRHLLDFLLMLWIYSMNSTYRNDVMKTSYLLVMWLLQGLVPLLAYLLSYILAAQDFLRSYEIFVVLNDLTYNKDDNNHRKLLSYAISIALNLPRMILDTSIFASVCSISKHHTEFDPLSYAWKDQYITKLANMHAMMREGKIDLNDSPFIYHPECYQLSLIISQSWALFIYFIGVDCLILQILPLLMKVVNMVIIIKKVQKNNEFRKQTNVRLIPLFTLKFIGIVIEIMVLSICLIIFVSAIIPIIWNDPNGLFMEKNLSNIKQFYFSYSLALSFLKYSLLMPLRMVSNRST